MRISWRIFACLVGCPSVFSIVAAAPPVPSEPRCYQLFKIDSVPVGAHIYDEDSEDIGVTSEKKYVLYYHSCSWVEYYRDHTRKCVKLLKAKKEGYDWEEQGAVIDNCDHNSVQEAKHHPTFITFHLGPKT